MSGRISGDAAALYLGALMRHPDGFDAKRLFRDAQAAQAGSRAARARLLMAAGRVPTCATANQPRLVCRV